MNNTTIAYETYKLVKKDLELNQIPDSENLLDVLKKHLSTRVKYLLDNDFSALLNALYRIDLSESKVQAILSTQPIESLADELATAIIDREKQKAITRLHYR